MNRWEAVAGPPRYRDALLRSVILQIACRHPPSRLHFVVTVGAEERPPPELLAWLPHTRTDGAWRGQGGHPLVWGSDLICADDLSQVPSSVSRVLLTGPDNAVLQRPGLSDQPFRPSLLSLPRARSLARAHVARARSDAEVLPEAPFAAALAETGPDPLALAERFAASPLVVMRRLAGVAGVPAGLVTCDGSGT